MKMKKYVLKSSSLQSGTHLYLVRQIMQICQLIVERYMKVNKNTYGIK
mgnify:CR=1 FL=1